MKNKISKIFLAFLVTISFIMPVNATIIDEKVEKETEEKGSNSPSPSPYSRYVKYISGQVADGTDGARLMQKALNATMNCELDVTGRLDSKTRTCIRNFQKKYGIIDPTLVGEKTIGNLNYVYKFKKIIVDCSSLNIRQYPNTSSSILAKAKKGTILTYISETTVNGAKWYKITYNNVIGYVHSNYVADDFIEVDITSQVLRLYKDKNLFLDSLIVTGKYGTHDTNKGYYKIFYTQRDRLLNGETFVNYWMRFISSPAIGLHDSSWRGTRETFQKYGGIKYKGSGAAGSSSSGSHGCVNIPLEKMEIIWNNAGMKTIVYVH